MPIRLRVSAGIEAWVMIAGCSIRLSTPPQTFGQGEQPGAFQHSPRARQIAIKHRGDHPAETPGHLLARQVVLGMAGQARINHLDDVGPVLQPAGDFQAVLAMTLHAQGQGLHTAQGQERVERRGHGPDSVLQEAHRLGELGVLSHHQGAADDV